MKKMIFASALMLSAFMTKAQTEKGNVLIGADFASTSLQFSGGNSTFNLSVNPTAAWFIKKNLALGGAVEIGYNKTKGADGVFTYGVSPLVRYYFAGEDRTKYYGQAKVGFGGASVGGSSSTYVGAGAGVGLNHWFTNSVALNVGLAYDYKHLTKSGSDAINAVSLGVGLEIFLPSKKMKGYLKK
jgi:hypothetical protein